MVQDRASRAHTADGQSRRRSEVGGLLRDWRARRRFSQFDLALDVGVSPRHLSFIETGRSRPSVEMIDALADRLEMPLRERNRLLMAAGFAPRYPERSLDAPALEQAKASVQRMLDLHDPYPGVALDRYWNVLLSNAAASNLLSSLPDELLKPPVNIFRVSLHPHGLAALTENFAEWGSYLVRTLRRNLLHHPGTELEGLEKEVLSYSTVKQLPQQFLPEPACLIPCVLRLPVGLVSMFTTLTTFGTPQDVLLEELSVELFYPADKQSEALLRSISRSGGGQANDPGLETTC